VLDGAGARPARRARSPGRVQRELLAAAVAELLAVTGASIERGPARRAHDQEIVPGHQLVPAPSIARRPGDRARPPAPAAPVVEAG